jgi:hypothetical protein
MTAVKRDSVVMRDPGRLRQLNGNQGRTDDQSRSTEGLGTPTHDEIARRAYEIYEERGGVQGLDVDDWIRAERELVQSR